ncbi:MAG: hypothetical protein ACLSVP_00730 [Fusobacterium sp.]
MEFKKTVTQFKEAIKYLGDNAEELKQFILNNLEGEGNEACYDEKKFLINFKRDGKDISVEKKVFYLEFSLIKKTFMKYII